MAGTTICAELPVVSIVLGVTGVTGRVELRKDVVKVTLITGQAGMRTG